MSLYLIILPVFIILNIFLVSIILSNNRKNPVNITYSAIILLSVLWTISIFMMWYSQSIQISLFWARLSFVGPIIMPSILFIFVEHFPFTASSKQINVAFVISLLCSTPIYYLLANGQIISSVTKLDNITIPKTGPLYLVFGAFFVSFISVAYYFLFRKMKECNRVGRSQISYLFVGIALSAISGLIINILLPVLRVDQYTFLGPVAMIFMISLTTFAIVRRGLFDIRLAIVRSTTYSLLVATLAGIYAGSTFAISSVFSFGQSTPAQIVANIAISLILVFLFQPLRRFFDKITNRIFYKDNYNSDEFFGRLNKTLAVTTDLRELLKRASKEIGTTLKSSQAFFYIYTSDSEHHIAAGTSNHTDMTIGVAEDIKQYAINKPGVVVATILEDDNDIKQVLTTHKIEIVLPLIQDKAIIGFLCLGENMGSNYTDRDVSVLNTVSNGLIIAIQNALAVQEIRDFNVTLRQRIAEATQELRVKNAMLKKLDKAKDEFVSMASHQLRTPLTSVKGYLSMVVEGDAGKVTSQQKELLNEAYSSNERMVNLVNDFLNVSRIQTGKFMLEKLPVDLAKLVDEEVKGLVQNATKRQIKLDYKAPVDVPQLNIDEGKIRQVVMNYIDNAIYYSNTDSTIKIDLSVDGDDVVFTVKDTGIGVPVSEQSGLFTKFYRASNAKKQRPDGTGVGLYLAKKIITAHDGKIVFSTVEGRGSTFGFRLPIKELALSTAKQLNDLKD